MITRLELKRHAPFYAFCFLVAATLLVWHLPYANLVLSPLEKFVGNLHETCRVTTCIITGGTVTAAEAGNPTGELTVCQGGWSFLWLQAGYLGTAALGCLLFYASGKQEYAKRILIGLGVLTVVVSFFLMNRAFDQLTGQQGVKCVFWAIGITTIFIYLANKLSARWAQVLVKYIACVMALAVVSDVMHQVLYWCGAYPAAEFLDAKSMAANTFVPAILWSLFWASASFGMLYLTVRLIRRKLAPAPAPAPVTTTPAEGAQASS